MSKSKTEIRDELLGKYVSQLEVISQFTLGSVVMELSESSLNMDEDSFLKNSIGHVVGFSSNDQSELTIIVFFASGEFQNYRPNELYVISKR